MTKPVELESLLKQLQDLESMQEMLVSDIEDRAEAVEAAEITLENAREALTKAEDAADRSEVDYSESRSALVEAIGEETIRIYNSKYAL